MIYSTSPVALLDACILYPAPLRDLLFHIADRGLYRPKWTDKDSGGMDAKPLA